jgi:predicted O-methyltransferase YrrM
MIRRILNRITDNSAHLAAGKAADTLALNILNDIDIDIGFMPWTRAAMRPSTILHILNEIFINDRRSIIEFGSGVSTIYLAWAAKQLEANVISIEENESWASKIRAHVENIGAGGVCHVQAIGRKPLDGKGYKSYWYDVDQVNNIIGDRTFDVVIVDGPTAFQAGQEHARRPAIDVLQRNLSENYAIFLDDALRPGEQQALAAWESLLGVKASLETINGGHAFLGQGQRFFSGL